MKKSHRLRILGREIQVKSSASVESVRAIETYLNDRAVEVATSLPDADQQLIALLLLLNVTESYLALNSGAAVGDNGFSATVEGLVAKIDSALGE